MTELPMATEAPAESFRFSQLSEFQACPRKYYWRWERRKRPIFDGTPLSVGSAVHAAIAALYRGASLADAVEIASITYNESLPPELVAKLDADEQLKVTQGWEVVKTVLAKYPYRDVDFDKVVAVEETLRLSMAPGIEYEGTLDRVVMQNDRAWVHDTKTTGWTLAIVSKAHRLRQQYVGYYKLAKTLGHDVGGVILDFIKKPRVYTRKDGSHTVSGEGFVREPIHVSAAQVEEFDGWFRRVVDDISESRHMLSVEGAGLAESWPMNTGTCSAFNRICPYFELCRFPDRAEQLLNGFADVE